MKFEKSVEQKKILNFISFTIENCLKTKEKKGKKSSPVLFHCLWPCELFQKKCLIKISCNKGKCDSKRGISTSITKTQMNKKKAKESAVKCLLCQRAFFYTFSFGFPLFDIKKWKSVRLNSVRVFNILFFVVFTNKMRIYAVCFFCALMWCLKKKNLSLICRRRTKKWNKKAHKYTHSMEHMDIMTCRRAVRLKPNHVFHCDKITMIDPYNLVLRYF